MPRPRHAVEINSTQTVAVSGIQNFKGITEGLKMMKAWCTANCENWTYAARSCRFIFATKEDAERFQQAFPKAFIPAAVN